MVRTKATFNNDVVYLQLEPTIKLNELIQKIRHAWSMSDSHVITVKWLDDEADLCVLSSQLMESTPIFIKKINFQVS